MSSAACSSRSPGVKPRKTAIEYGRRPASRRESAAEGVAEAVWDRGRYGGLLYTINIKKSSILTAPSPLSLPGWPWHPRKACRLFPERANSMCPTGNVDKLAPAILDLNMVEKGVRKETWLIIHLKHVSVY